MQVTIKLPDSPVSSKDGTKLGTGAEVVLKLSRWQFAKFALSILWRSIEPTYETKQALLAWIILAVFLVGLIDLVRFIVNLWSIFHV